MHEKHDYVELILADVIITINRGSSVDAKPIVVNQHLFSSIEQKTELFNAILLPRKRRYTQCFSDEQRAVEKKMLIDDFVGIFRFIDPSFASEDLISAYFDFLVANQYDVVMIRHLTDMTRVCATEAIKKSIASTIISTIIRCRLYGDGGYDAIMEECADILRALITN